MTPQGVRLGAEEGTFNKTAWISRETAKVINNDTCDKVGIKVCTGHATFRPKALN